MIFYLKILNINLGNLFGIGEMFFRLDYLVCKIKLKVIMIGIWYLLRFNSI